MKIGIGADEAGFEMKEMLGKYLRDQGHEVINHGVYNTDPSLYPDTALKVAVAVAAGEQERGIIICGTGIGMAMTANKVPGIRAAQCHDTYSAERAQKSNNAQIITMGARVIGPELAKHIVDAWMHSDFKNSKSGPKVNRIMEIEQSFHQKQ